MAAGLSHSAPCSQIGPAIWGRTRRLPGFESKIQSAARRMRHHSVSSRSPALGPETMTQLRKKAELASATESDPRWARLLARDRSADGEFWYSVATTKVYCRPSCPSRSANPGNVGLHGSLAEAKATGFRPCKRCNPDGPPADVAHAAIVAKACRLIEGSEEVPSLAGLAKAASLSTSYFHRLFKSVPGLTPKDYALADLASRGRDGLAR